MFHFMDFTSKEILITLQFVMDILHCCYTTPSHRNNWAKLFSHIPNWRTPLSKHFLRLKNCFAQTTVLFKNSFAWLLQCPKLSYCFTNWTQLFGLKIKWKVENILVLKGCTYLTENKILWNICFVFETVTNGQYKHVSIRRNFFPTNFQLIFPTKTHYEFLIGKTPILWQYGNGTNVRFNVLFTFERMSLFKNRV